MLELLANGYTQFDSAHFLAVFLTFPDTLQY